MQYQSIILRHFYNQISYFLSSIHAIQRSKCQRKSHSNCGVVCRDDKFSGAEIFFFVDISIDNELNRCVLLSTELYIHESIRSLSKFVLFLKYDICF